MSGPDPEGRVPQPDCILDEIRFVDTEADPHEYGYGVGCVAEHACGYWREMFRLSKSWTPQESR